MKYILIKRLDIFIAFYIINCTMIFADNCIKIKMPKSPIKYSDNVQYTFTPENSFLNLDYYDGLGRIILSIKSGYSDILKCQGDLLEYDNNSRIIKTYNAALNYNESTDCSQYKSEIKGYGQDNYLMTHTKFDNIFDDKSYFQIYQGANWHINNKGVLVEKKYNGNTLIGKINGSYISFIRLNQNNIEQTRRKDEDGCIITEYHDLSGKIICEQKSDLATYYIYDDYQNLCYVLPPNVSTNISENSILSLEDDVIDKYAFCYKYDEWNRCIAKKMPGCDWTYYVYDKSGMLTYSQNGNQRLLNEWSYFIYDRFDRIAIEGVLKDNSSHQNLISRIKNLNCRTVFGKGGTLFGYDGKVNYAKKNTVKLVYFYDNYSFLDLSDFSANKSSLGYEESENYGKLTPDFPNGLLTGKMQRIANSDKFNIVEAYYYDIEDRVIQSNLIDEENFMERYKMTYSFAGNLRKSLWERFHLNQQNIILKEEYEYILDQSEQVIEVKRNDTTLVHFEYDQWGRKAKEILPDNLGNVLYTYNERGYITNINAPTFSQKLYYEKKDNQESGYYNGSISQIETINDNSSLKYSYTYDKNNRLIHSKGEQIDLDETASYQEYFSEFFHYDGNSNIINLSRNLMNHEIDNLAYEYSGNQLKRIDDPSGSLNDIDVMEFTPTYADESGHYKYDSNGNLIRDLNKGIGSIHYNFLNLPDTIQFMNGNQIINKYYSDGTKRTTTYVFYPINIIIPFDTIIKQGEDPLYTEKVDYRKNYQFITSNNKTELKRILTPFGCISNEFKGDGSDIQHNYHIKDYQGNIQQIIGKYSAGNGNINVDQTNDYYPSGTLRSTSTNQNKYSYKYNGKELNRMFGLDWYDYGARYYDPVAYRWHSIDPLAEKYYSISPYVYCAGNPVMYIDPDGRKVEITGTRAYIDKVKKDIRDNAKDSPNFKAKILSLIQSDNIHGIKMPEGTGNSAKAVDPKNLDKSQGSTISYDPDNKTVKNSSEERTPRVGLAHELQHSVDLDTGKMEDEMNAKNENGVPKCEISAIELENEIREKTNDKKRDTYGGKKI